MQVFRAFRCAFHGHEWRPRRFAYEEAYCRECRRCGTRSRAHAWSGCLCETCGEQRDASSAAHNWEGCKCAACSLERHVWRPWKEGLRCTHCGAQQLSWLHYLRHVTGKSFASDTDFVLQVAEAIRKELYQKYETARERFSRRPDWEATRVRRIDETAEPKRMPDSRSESGQHIHSVDHGAECTDGKRNGPRNNGG